MDGEIDAVGRRAVDRELTGAHLVDAQRPIERERVTTRALLAIRRHHHHLGELGEGLGHRAQTLGMNAVVVGEEDAGASRHEAIAIRRGNER